MRHYSKVILSVPDGPDDPQELGITIECDVCGTFELSTHIAHFGTLVRTLTDLYGSLAWPTDNGVSAGAGTFRDRGECAAHLNRHFPEWKAERLRRHGS